MYKVENKQSHTPLPWRIGDAGLTIFGPPNGSPSPETIVHAPHTTNVLRGAVTKSNIAYIVRVCNQHEELVKALESALAAIETPGDLTKQDRDYLMDDIESVLSRAKGESK